MSQPKLMIYGATGYTGRLVAAEATKSGVWPVLAGRSEERLRAVAGPLGLETRAVSLDTADLLAAALEDITVVLHCAGPFSRTALPMFEACLTAGAHYLDITGEVAVCEALAARDTAAREAGIMVLPSAGFDVVPSDCLIADLAARCPGGRVVRLGVATHSGASRGTMRTILESVNNFRIRRDGAIERGRARQPAPRIRLRRRASHRPGQRPGGRVHGLPVHRDRQHRDLWPGRSQIPGHDAAEPPLRLVARGSDPADGVEQAGRPQAERDPAKPSAGVRTRSWLPKSRMRPADASPRGCVPPIRTASRRRRRWPSRRGRFAEMSGSATRHRRQRTARTSYGSSTG